MRAFESSADSSTWFWLRLWTAQHRAMLTSICSQSIRHLGWFNAHWSRKKPPNLVSYALSLPRRCRARQRATKQMSIARLPPVLAMHVKRFEAGGVHSQVI